MKKLIYAFIIIGFTQCTETIEEPINLPVNVKGKVNNIGEFGNWLENELKNTEIIVESDNQTVGTTKTDSLGNYHLELRTGTYKIKLKRENCTPMVYQGLKLVGGEETIYHNMSIFQKSSTQISDLNIEANSNQLNIGGTVTHNSPYQAPYNRIKCIIYFSSSPAVSSTNFNLRLIFEIGEESGSNFSFQRFYSKKTFPSESTVYAIAYGIGYSDYGYLDFEKNTDIFPSIGEIPSNVSSFIIP